MERGLMRKYQVFLLFSLFVSLFLFNVPGVIAQETVGAEVINNLADAIRELASELPGLSGVDEGDTGGFAKFLFFLLILIITFGISLELPFLGESGTNARKFLALGIAIVVSLLSTLYLDADQIKTILLSYNALGITLTAIIPFIFVTFISMKLQGSNYAFFSKVVWIVFAIVLIFVWALAKPGELGTLWWAYPVTLLAILGMFIFERPLFRQFMKDKLEAMEERINRTFAKADARTRAAAASAGNLALPYHPDYIGH
jgi:hypothetical protein